MAGDDQPLLNRSRDYSNISRESSSETLRHKLYDVLEAENLTGRIFNYVIFFVICFNIICFALSTEETLDRKAGKFFDWVEIVSVIIFSVEYLLRMYAIVENPEFSHPCYGRLKYAITFFAVVDIIAILPFFLDYLIPGDLVATQFVRIFRLLRLLKAEGRYVEAFTTFDDVFRQNKFLLATSCFVGGAAWILFAALMYVCEKDNLESSPLDNPRFGSIPRSMFYSLLMMFGEFPVTDFTVAGKFVAGVASVVAVGVAAIPTGILGAGFMDIVNERRKNRDVEIEDHKLYVCSQCEDDRRFKTWRSRLFYFLEGEGPLGLIFHYFIFGLIVLNVITFVLGTIDSISRHTGAQKAFDIIEIISVVLFTIEYIARVVACVEEEPYASKGPFWGRLRYMVSFYALVDLVAIFPFYIDLCLPQNLAASTFIRVFRLLRMFKAEKYIEAFTVFDDVLRANADVLATTVFAGGVAWIFFSSLMYICERNHNSDDINIREGFKSVPRSMWYTLLMMSGEFPLCDFTAWGQVVASLIGIFAVGVFAIPTGILGAGFEEWVMQKNDKEEREKELRLTEEISCCICLKPCSPPGHGDDDVPMLDDNDHNMHSNSSLYNPTDLANEDDLMLGSHSRDNTGVLSRIFHFFNGDGIGFYFQLGMFLLIFVNVIVMIIDTIDHVHHDAKAQRAFQIIEIVSVALFTLEYLMRLISCSANPALEGQSYKHLRFVFSFFSIIDLLAIIPFYIDIFVPGDIPATTALRLFRLLLVLEFDRFAEAFTLIDDVFRQKKFILIVTGFVTMVLWIIFSTLLYLVEKEDFQKNAEDDQITQAYRFSSVLQAMPYTLVLLTGDYPLVRFSILGKIICGVMIFVGVGLVAIPSGVIATGFMDSIAEAKLKRKLEAEDKNDDNDDDDDNELDEQCVSCRENEAKEKGNLAQLFLFLQGDSKWGRVFEYFILSLIVVNILSFILSTEHTITDKIGELPFTIIEWVSVVIFTIEFIFRFIAASEDPMFKSRYHFLLSFYAIVDILAIVPFWITVCINKGDDDTNLTILRILRLARLFKAEHYIEAFTVMDNVVRDQRYLLFVTMFASGVIWIALATSQYYTQTVLLDSPYCENYYNIPSALFMTIIALGGEWSIIDFNWAGHIIACFMCVIAIALFSIPAGIFFGGFEDILTERQELKTKRLGMEVNCKTCGKTIKSFAHLRRLADE